MNVHKILVILKKNLTLCLILPIVTFLLYWPLWYFFDTEAYNEGGYSFHVVMTDFLYCIVLGFSVLLACVFWHSVFYKYLHRQSINMTVSMLSIFSSILIAVLFEHLSDYIISYWTYSLSRTFEGYIICSLISCVISVIYLSHVNFGMFKNQVREKELKEVALLKQQLDPHFVFNNLSSLDGLIDSNPADAHIFLAKLSKVYRYMIQYTLNDKVPIEEEIRFIRAYEHMLSVRFQNHFIITIDSVLEEGPSGSIVPMTLQLLIENAIKHNCHSEEQPIEIRIERQGDKLVVSNTYRPFSDVGQKSGHGQGNLDRRYFLLFNKHIDVEITEDYYTVKIPII